MRIHSSGKHGHPSKLLERDYRVVMHISLSARGRRHGHDQALWIKK